MGTGELGGQGWRDRDAASLARETKTAREAAAALWPDTAERLARLVAALEAQQDRENTA